MNDTDVVAALAALAHPLRLRIFRALVVTGESGLTPGVIREALRIPAATLSFHLSELVDAGLVGKDRSGRFLIYRAEPDRMDALIAGLIDPVEGPGTGA